MRAKLRKKEKEYAQVHKNMLHDMTVSFKSKGLGALLESYSNDFDIKEKTLLSKSNKDKKTSLSTAVKELEPHYLCRFKTRSQEGTFEVVWIFDSQGLDDEYVLQIIKGYKVLDIFTRAYEHLVPTLRKSSSGSSSSGKSSVGESTSIYNNDSYKNENYNNSSLERVKIAKNYLDFRRALIEYCPTFEFTLAGKIGYSFEHQGFDVTNGLLKDKMLSRPMSLQEIDEVWKYIFSIKTKFLEVLLEQKELFEKTAS